MEKYWDLLTDTYIPDISHLWTTSDHYTANAPHLKGLLESIDTIRHLLDDPYFYAAVPLIAFVLLAIRSRARRGGLPLPPGPLGIPWVGNIIGLDVAQPWVTYTKYGEKYGK